MNNFKIAGSLIFLSALGYMFMKTSKTGIDKIKEHESLSLTPYKDIAGKWTIGYGHLLKPGEWWESITEQFATVLLSEDLKIAEDAIKNLVKVSLNQNQFDALTSFVFNVGVDAFSQSTLLKRINSKDYTGAANEFTRWKYAGGNISQGLLSRRKREQALFLS